MASSDVVKAKIASLGMSLLQPATSLAALERLLAAPALAGRTPYTHTQLHVSAHSSVDVVPFKWGRMAQRYQPLPDLFKDVVDGGLARSTTAPTSSSTAIRSVGAPAGAGVASRRQQQHEVSMAAVTQEKLLTAIRAAVQDVLGREVSTLCQVTSLYELLVVLYCSGCGVGLATIFVSLLFTSKHLQTLA
jgi:hypothetical protein